MPQILRFPPTAAPAARAFAGVSVRARGGEIHAALVSADGRGLAASVIDVRTAQACVNGVVAAAQATSLETVCDQRRRVAEAAAEVLGGLLEVARPPLNSPLAVAVHDPGYWRIDRGSPIARVGWCDPQRLAELTGLNVIDDLPGRDLACGGNGGPVLAFAEWILLRDANRPRLLVDLGRTLRATFVPPLASREKATDLWSYQFSPGMALIDLLAARMSSGRTALDAGGSMAVQGRCLDELLEHWLREAIFDRPPPRWHPQGVRVERFLSDALQMAVRADWAVRDLLCTATHLLAESVRRLIVRRLSEVDLRQLIVSGGGQHNGFLLREIARRCGLPVVRAADVIPFGDALEPAAVALMGLLHVDQTPANSPLLTGAGLSRVLGRLTPGTAPQWQRLLREMAGLEPAARSLRSAL